jgi:diguanylate cyclase (GGDEF)-like protein
LETLRLFFSAPHWSHQTNTPVGIVGLSVSVKKMADMLKPQNPASVLGLITEDGIVFASSDPQLLYKMVLPIAQHKVTQIRDSQQFGSRAIESAGISLDKTRVMIGQTTYSVQRAKLQNTNIEFFSLHPLDEKGYLLFLCGVGSIYLLIVFLGFRLATSLRQIKMQQATLQTSNALLLESQRALLHQATHDPLTDLLNRRAALEQLTKELARSKRSGEGVAVGMGDIDHFKKINDTWGHQTGDEVLRQVSQILVKGVREYDIVARWGGEEFLWIAPIKAGVDTDAVFARLCQTVANSMLNTSAGKLAVTISIGVAYATGEETVEYILAAADTAMYQAKAQGRNRVVYANKS